MKKLRILQTPVRYYPDIGGVENHVYYLSKELIKLGQKVEVVAAGSNNQKALHVDGVIVKRLRTWFKITNTNITLTLPWILLKSDFDIIHTHMPTPWSCDWSILIGKLKGKKTIVTIHNDMNKTSFFSKIATEIYLNTFFIASLILVDKIIIVNPSWRDNFSNTRRILQMFIKKISIIPNGVDTNLFKPSTLKRGSNSVLFVSILDKHHKFKGLEYLLEAVAEAKAQIPDLILTVVGDGELVDHYKQIADKLKINDATTFLGSKNQCELAKLYRQADVFVLPSIEIEGFGIVAIEALTSGIPVICTKIVGVAEEITKYNSGIVINMKDSAAISDALIYLLKSRNVNVSSHFRKTYSWNTIAESVQNVYLNII